MASASHCRGAEDHRNGEAGWATRTIREIQLTQPASASPSLTSDKLPIEQVNSPDITN
jgi:hypothetical protein